MNSFVVGSNRKIDPSRRAHLQGDGTPADNDRVEIGPTRSCFSEWQEAGLTRRSARPSRISFDTLARTDNRP